MASTTSTIHARSSSLPPRSHPLAQRFEEELNKLKTWAASSANRAACGADLCTGLEGLGQLQASAHNLLKMPQAQAALTKNKHGRWVTEELDGSVRLLDVCSSTRNALSSMKEHARGLLSALRTRKIGDSVLQGRVAAYISFKKNARKNMHTFFKTLRQMELRCELNPHMEGSHEGSSLIVSAMMEARAMTIIVIRSIFSFFFESERSNSWSFVSMALKRRSGRVDNEAHGCPSEMERADAFLRALISKKEICDETNLSNIKNRLVGLEATINDVEVGLESLFQKLIRNRVFILNIINM